MATDTRMAEPTKAKEAPAPATQPDLTAAEVAQLRSRLATAELRIDALTACGPSASGDWDACLGRELAARGISAEASAAAKGPEPEALPESPAAGRGGLAAGPAGA